MEVSFATSKLKKLCESRKALTKKHGEQCARRVMARIEDLESAKSLEELRELPGRCHELKGDRAGKLAVDLHGGVRLVFEAIGDQTWKPDGGLDWAAVEAVRITELVNYH